MITWRSSLKAILKLYGKKHSRLGYPGSPYEGERALDKAELALHELAHITLLGIESKVPRPGAVDDRLKALPAPLANLHEIKAGAITLLVARELGIPIELGRIYWAIWRNLRRPGPETEEWRTPDDDWTFRTLHRATQLKTVQRRAAQLTHRVKDLL